MARVLTLVGTDTGVIENISIHSLQMNGRLWKENVRGKGDFKSSKTETAVVTVGSLEIAVLYNANIERDGVGNYPFLKTAHVLCQTHQHNGVIKQSHSLDLGCKDE